MDIALNWNEWHQETVRKPYARVGVTLLSGALILMSAQEIVSLYLENTCFARSIGVIPWEKLNFFIISRIIKKCGLLKHPIPEVAIRITYCLLCDGLIIFCSRYIVSPAIKKP